MPTPVPEWRMTRSFPFGCAAALMALGLFLAALPAAADPVHIDGQAQQGGLMMGQAPGASEVRLDGEPVMVSDDGRFLFAFGRDSTQPAVVEVLLADGTRWQGEFTPEPREFDIQRIDGLPDHQVTPPPEVQERIREDNRLIGQARRRRDARSDWREGFIWPLIGPVTGVYGSQRILNGQPRNPHWGIDIAAPVGTPVRAPAPGVVTLAHPDMYYSGGTLFVDHGHGLVSAFLHLDSILVETGQRVDQGEIIGRVGATGRVTGPHLDWRMNLGSVRIDPALLLDWETNPHADAR